MKRTATFGIAILTTVLVVLTGCTDSGDSTKSGVSAVRVVLTDAATDYLAEAEVRISSVRLVPGDDVATEADGSPHLELLDAEESPRTFDLLELRDGVTAFLAEKPVPEGTYEQLRMIVEDARVVLADGYTFEDGTTEASLTVPSGPQTGIKVALDGGIAAEEGTVTIVVVDFDADESFVIQGDPESPAGIRGILFTPVLREIGRSMES